MAVIAALAGIAIVGRRAAAQSAPPAAAPLVGVVRDASGAPVTGVEVRARAGRVERVVTTDEAGVFRLYDLPGGTVALNVRHVGFAPGTLEVPEGRRTAAPLSLVLSSVAPLRLDAVRVEEVAPVVPRLEGFERRRALGAGTLFITREQIVKQNALTTTELISRTPTLKIADSMGTLVPMSRRGLKVDRTLQLVPCVMRIGVDGHLMPWGFSANEIRPNDIHGIEVFGGPATIPVQFGGLRTDNWCGLVMIWTRAGG